MNCAPYIKSKGSCLTREELLIIYNSIHTHICKQQQCININLPQKTTDKKKIADCSGGIVCYFQQQRIVYGCNAQMATQSCSAILQQNI